MTSERSFGEPPTELLVAAMGTNPRGPLAATKARAALSERETLEKVEKKDATTGLWQSSQGVAQPSLECLVVLDPELARLDLEVDRVIEGALSAPAGSPQLVVHYVPRDPSNPWEHPAAAPEVCARDVHSDEHPLDDILGVAAR